MKKMAALLIISAVLVTIIPVGVYASDYQGNEKDDSLFQRLSDYVTGKYEIKGKPITKTGVFQPIADEVRKIETAPVQ